MFLFVNRIFVTATRKGLTHNALIQKHGLCQDRINSNSNFIFYPSALVTVYRFEKTLTGFTGNSGLKQSKLILLIDIEILYCAFNFNFLFTEINK